MEARLANPRGFCAGVDRAIEIAKELAEIPADEDVTIVHYPRKKGLMELITSGNGPMIAARWMMYRFIRQDLAHAVKLITSGAYSLERMTID